MILVLRKDATEADREEVLKRVKDLGLKPHVSVGEERTIIGVVGDDRQINPGPFEALQAVERVVPILKPFKLVSRDFQRENTRITIRGKKATTVEVGGKNVVVMAGPCAVE